MHMQVSVAMSIFSDGSELLSNGILVNDNE